MRSHYVIKSLDLCILLSMNMKNPKDKVQQAFSRINKNNYGSDRQKTLDEITILNSILTQQEMHILTTLAGIVENHDQKVILEAIDNMFEGYLVGLEQEIYPAKNPASVYEIYRKLKEAFLH